MPVTFWMMMIGSLALTGVGIPFTSIGFAGLSRRTRSSRPPSPRIALARLYAFWCADIAAALTAFYTWRLMFMTFFGKRGDWAASLPQRA